MQGERPRHTDEPPPETAGTDERPAERKRTDAPPPERAGTDEERPETARHPVPGVEHEPEPDAENLIPAEDEPGTF